MEDLHHNKIDDLDRCCSTDTTILLKALSLFLPSEKQPELLLLVKFLEMQQILQWLKKPQKKCAPMGPDDYEQVFAAIKPSLSEATAKSIEQILNMVSMFRMYQQMKDLMEVMGPFSADSAFRSCSEDNPSSDTGHPENNSPKESSDSGGMNGGMMELLKSMIPQENQAMVEMLMQMQQNPKPSPENNI